MPAPAHIDIDIGSSMVSVGRPSAAPLPVRVVQLERVGVTAKRLASATAVAQTGASETAAQRIQ